MAYEYTVREHNYQHSFNADSYTEDQAINEMVAAGWEIVDQDMGTFPYVHIMYRREVPGKQQQKGKAAD